MVTRFGSPPKAGCSAAPLQGEEPVEDAPVVGGVGIHPKPSKPRRYEIVTVTTPSRLKLRPSYQGLAGDPEMKRRRGSTP